MAEEILVLGKRDFSVVRKPPRNGAGSLENDVWLVFKHQDKKGAEMKISINLSSLVRQSHPYKVQGLDPEQELQAFLASAPKRIRVYRQNAVFRLCERVAATWFEAIDDASDGRRLIVQPA